MIEMRAYLVGDAAVKQLEAVRKEWGKALIEEGMAIQKEYEKTVKTWKTKVSFQMSRKDTADELSVTVRTQNRIYWFVHESVSVMRGVLSPDWSPKTQPRVLGSGAGSGRLLYASKSVNLPPYEAREFTEKIIEERLGKFQKRMEQATARGAKKAAGG